MTVRTGLTLLWAIAAACFGAFGASAAYAQTPVATKVVDRLEEPWALAFLPDGAFLVTEREGKLSLFSPDGKRMAVVGGLPEVAQTGQGGLLDVLVTRNFAQTRRIWISFAAPAPGGSGTSAGFGRLSADGSRIEAFQTVLTPQGRPGGRHFGSRLVEAADGTVFVTTGDRGFGALAQDLRGPEGKVLTYDAEGNPKTHAAFADRAGVWPGLYSLGHRNIQGATLDGRGRLITAEHGAKGGDEVNLVTGGQNHGWPVITYGVDYDGSKIGIGQSNPGMEQPEHYWDPSIAPSGLMYYSGDMFPEWKGHIFTGSLKSDFISRLDPGRGYAEEPIKLRDTRRVRDIRQAPDGSIWFLSVDKGAVYRLTPAN